jgi:hypothetical protein
MNNFFLAIVFFALIIPYPNIFFSISLSIGNNSVIQEYDYKQLINKVIDKYLIQYHNNKIDIRLLWDAMKVEIREVTICASLTFWSYIFTSSVSIL